MEWFKTTSAFWSHPKVWGLKDRTFRVLVSSWGYAAQHDTAGRISRVALDQIKGKPADAEALVHAGLWHPDGDGWRIHEWDDHQDAALAWHDRKARDRERKRAARVRGRSADSPPDQSAESPHAEKRREEERREPPLPPSADTTDTPGANRTQRRTRRPTLAEQIARAEQLAAAHTVNGRIVYDPDPEEATVGHD